MLNKLIEGISSIFLPIANLLSAAGIMKGILAILTASGAVSTASDNFLILNAMADALFYFLPVLLASTAARKFQVNPYVCMVIACVLLYPSLSVQLTEGHSLTLFGIPIRAVSYHSSVIPIILAVVMLHYLEPFLNRSIPVLLRSFLTPMFSILIVSFVTLFIFGPLGAVIGDLLATGYTSVYLLSPVIAGLLLGAIIQPMVIFGFHWSFVLIAMNNIAISGGDTVMALIGPPVFAQAGAALAVMLKSHNQEVKSICASAALSSIFGVTEPAMFNINLPRKKPMIAVCISGGLGGALAGFSGAQAHAFAFPSIATLPVFLGNGFFLFVCSCLLGLISGFLLTLVLHNEHTFEI